jgi:serine/threonine protein kinase/Tfp pilus assembly protein PilF
VSLPVRPAITREISSVPQLRGQKRYLLEKELARGGLGKVWLSQDRHIARQVAIKELLPAALRSPAMVDRFFEEAQVTGQLEHPGIVPIYELGLKPDGSPFYAMKLLTGRTLSEAIKEYHALPPDDPARPLKFAELLKVFVDVCNAMAYAHSRQVIHRDLKPVNVMLGEYGEAIVVDWGLAKSIGQRDIAPTAEAPEELKSTTMLSSVVRTTWRGEESKTMVGSILGTPAYMPPEQAMGQLDKLDVRSDVYSLGAILYEILVGRPPYRGKSGFELVNMVISGRFDPPRTVNPNVPPELNAICLKAMTYVKEERYPSAKFLAEDVKRWQADEPVSVYPERWQKRVRRWVKRHRTICVSTAASLLAVVILAGLWKWADLRDSAWRGDEGARALRNANDAVGRGDLAEATQVLARAMAITEKPGLAGLYRQIKDLHDDVQAKLKSQQARDNAQKTFDRFEQLRFDAVLNGTLMSGTDEATQLETALELAQQALELYGVSIESGSLPPFDNPYLSPVEIDKIREGCYELLLICANAIANPQPNQSASQMSENAGRALALLELAEKLALPTKVSHLQRAMYLAQQGKQAESDAAAKLFDATPSKKSLDFFLVGLTHYNQRRYDDAIENFEEALALDPEHFWAQYFAALSFLHLDRPAEAIAHLNACRSLKTNFPWLYVIRGFVTGMRAQQLEKAGARSQLVGEAFQDADNDFATALQYEGDHVYAAYVNRGMLRLERGQLDQAAQDLTKAVDQNPNAYRAYTGLAQVYWRQGKTTQAFAEIERALEKARGASWPLRLRGQFHFEQKNYREALRDLDAAVLRSELGGRQASAQDYALRGEVQLVALANESNPAAKKIGHQRARSDFDRALAIDPDYRPARRLRARVLQELGELEAAYQELERYMTNHPNPTGSDYAERAVYRLLRDDSAGAIADITRALQLGVSTDRADRPLLIRRAWAMLNDGAQIAQDDFDAMLAKAKPDDPYAADWYLGRAYARVLLGRTTEATKDVERALPLIQKSNQPRERITWSFNAACVYAQAVARTAFPADDPARQAEALRYHTEALRLLRQAVSFVAPEARAAYVAQVFKDPALDPIRHSKEFKQLVAEFSAAAR